MVGLRMCSTKMNTARFHFCRLAPFMDDIVFLKEGVTKLLKTLNTLKVLGPDELRLSILKVLATELGLGFVHHFQQFLDTGEIP